MNRSIVGPTVVILLEMCLFAGHCGSTSGAQPIPPAELLAHFPSRMHACVWRNWQAVEPERIAKVLGTSVENVTRVAESMGLPPATRDPAGAEDQRIFLDDHVPPELARAVGRSACHAAGHDLGAGDALSPGRGCCQLAHARGEQARVGALAVRASHGGTTAAARRRSSRRGPAVFWGGASPAR